MTARREDLLLEVIEETFPANGEYVSDWIDSADVLTIRTAASGQNTGTGLSCTIAQSNDGTNLIAGVSVGTGSPAKDVDIVARMFRLHVTNGTSGGILNAVVRAVA